MYLCNDFFLSQKDHQRKLDKSLEMAASTKQQMKINRKKKTG